VVREGGEIDGYFVHDRFEVPGFERTCRAVDQVHVGVFLAQGL